MAKRRKKPKSSLRDQLRKVLASFPCPECGARMVITETLKVPEHHARSAGHCDGSGCNLAWYEDGIAAIPRSVEYSRIDVEARKRLRAMFKEFPPSDRHSSSHPALYGGRHEVSGGLPGTSRRH